MKQAILALLLFLLPLKEIIATPGWVVDSIPMSDGKMLAADVWIPAGMDSGPVILIQTPYDRELYRIGGLPLGVGLNINSSNYIFVIVDWRGFYGSKAAAYTGDPSIGQDGYNCVEWTAQQSWSNGKVATWGASALGRVQYQTEAKNPPHLVCICPTVAGPQYEYQEYFPNGDLRTEYLEQEDSLGFGLEPIVMANTVYDPTWSHIESSNFYPDSIYVPCFMIGGWYDFTIFEMLPFFSALQTQSPVNVRSQHRLLMGPWVHGHPKSSQVGTAQQGQLTYDNAAGWNDSLALMFFDYYLRNIMNGWDKTPAVQYYQMGNDVWLNSPSWPPLGPVNTNFYFHDGNIATTQSNVQQDSLTYNYDPNNPSPTIGGPTLRSDLVQGPYDQRDSVESRNDILIFTTDSFTQNLVMKGNAVVHLVVSSNRFDTDFDIRLTDVYPDGRSMLVNVGDYRLRFLNGFEATDTSAIVPGKLYDCAITLPTTCITFLTGHKLRVDVTSSNYPEFNRNMNTDGPMYPNESLDTLVNPLVATNTVYTGTQNESFITLPLVNFDTTGITGVSQIMENVSVYPNPANEMLNVMFTKTEKGILSLFDLQGRMIQSQEISGLNNVVLIRNIADGIYLLKIETGNNVVVRKVVVQR